MLIGTSGVVKEKLPQKVFKDARMLIRRMNDKTHYLENKEGTRFSSQMCSNIKINGQTRLYDNDLFIKPVKSERLYQGTAEITHKDISLTFDKKTGEILQLQKGEQVRSLLRVPMDMIKKQLSQARRDFKKPGVVQKTRLQINGLTEKGAKAIDEVAKIAPEKASSEKPVKQLVETAKEPVINTKDSAVTKPTKWYHKVMNFFKK